MEVEIITMTIQEKKSMSTGILAKFSDSRFVAAVLKLMTVAVITVILK